MALIPIFQKQQTDQPETINKVIEIPLIDIVPNPAQPRLIFDDYELSQLAVSIQQNGLLQPITVRRVENGYELISGERRVRASRLINMTNIPAIVIDTNDKNSAVLAIMENIQRSNLNYIEEALAIRGLIEHYDITQEEAAAKLGLAQSTIANKLRLLRLTDEEKASVLRSRLNERQARALLKLPHEKRAQAIEKISAEQLNTLQTDKLVEQMLEENGEQKKKPKRTWQFKQLGLYINTFNQTIDSMKKAGIDCKAEKNQTSEYVEYKIVIPLKQNS